MDVETALTQALIDEPGDAMTWLALADWLEEQGREPQARLMRLHRSLIDMPEDDARRRREDEVHTMLLGGVSPYTITATNSLGMTFALIPAGSFLMGSEEEEIGSFADEHPRRRVTLTKSFWLGVYPVTQQEYRVCTGINPSAYRPGGSQSREVHKLDTRRFPVETVSWHDAATFCRLLTRSSPETQAGRVYRLPTEAEWEYACRGAVVQMSPFPWGAKITTDQAHFRGPPSRQQLAEGRIRRTKEVGAYQPNALGLYDMVGNVWEWCGDWMGLDAYAITTDVDPRGVASGDRRVARGGAFHLEARRMRCADRSSFAPEHMEGDVGFRVVLEAD